MTSQVDRLYELLPAFVRLSDSKRGEPLRGLLAVINEQVDVVEADISRLYENWFIETCEDWVVPYIGDLLGIVALSATGSTPDPSTPLSRKQSRFLVPRREVAQTVALRRRKGTLAILDALALAVSDWPSRAVEVYRLLAVTQHVNHVHLHRGRTVDLRRTKVLDLIDGPFDREAHTSGRRTIPDVGVFVWRLRSYSVTHTSACCIDSVGPNSFTFNPLCHDTQLFNQPVFDGNRSRTPDEINLPVAIRRRAFEKRLSNHPLVTEASKAYYGLDRSLVIWAPDWPSKDAQQPLPADVVVPADLTDWQYRAHRGQVGVDPVLGRMVFPAGQFPRGGVWVSYQYGFSADMGCGEYHRTLTAPPHAARYLVSSDRSAEARFPLISDALDRWREDRRALGPPPADEVGRSKWADADARLKAAVIEIEDSAVYRERLTISLEAGESLQIRGADRTRPVIELVGGGSNRSEALTVWGKAGSRLTLDGLVITGGPLQINGPDPSDAERVAQGDLCDVTIRHVTLVPGWALECNCEPIRPTEPSLELIYSTARVIVDHSIIGSIDVFGDQVKTDPVEVSIADSIVDATDAELSAVGAPDLPLAFAQLSISRSTVIGKVETDSIVLAEDSIFVGEVRVARRQVGCMRFCSVAQALRTPRRYHCQPDLVRAAQPAIADREAKRVEPIFTSLRYGSAGYCQLDFNCAPEITRGATDESEVGAFHDLFQPQRASNLRVRLDEYMPAGMRVEVLFAN